MLDARHGMTIDDEVRRATQLLEALIQAIGMSQEEVEQRLEASPGYLGRLLSGRVELKLRHILAVLRALEIEPSLFFHTLYPEAGPEGGTVRIDELRQRVRSLGIGNEPAPTAGVGMEDLERLVQEAVQDALSRRKP
ncbi:MAG TPA: helix-turn-helix transcriptional regulator [Thermoanaerobaculia bacterium]|nr:helix-turn-helix transcriptional regulator [Thermoanaerobaculia bacterium]